MLVCSSLEDMLVLADTLTVVVLADKVVFAELEGVLPQIG